MDGEGGSEGTPTRLFVVAPTPMARAGLRAMLEGGAAGNGGPFVVVGEADSFAGEPLDADVVVVAVEEPFETPSSFPQAAVEGAPEASGVVLVTDDDRAVEALRGAVEGGWGLVPPDAPPEELTAAVEAVSRGLVVMPRETAGRLLGPPGTGLTGEAVDDPLTAREHEVLALLAQGLPNKRIARELGISEHTVKFHVSSVFQKLGAQSRAEAVSLGARNGLISL